MDQSTALRWRSSVPFTTERIRAAAIYCSDGRYGEQFDEFLHTQLHLPRYDRLAVPGGAACLAGHLSAFREEEAAREQLRFLIAVHKIERVVLIAHQSCAFYGHYLSVARDEIRARQDEDMRRAATRLRHLEQTLDVDGFFAAVEDQCVTFEPVEL
jgi:hypothetical protein